MNKYRFVIYKYGIDIHINKKQHIKLNTHTGFAVNLYNLQHSLKQYFLFRDKISFNIQINNSIYHFNKSPKKNNFVIFNDYKKVNKEKEMIISVKQFTKSYNKNIITYIQKYNGINDNEEPKYEFII